MLFEIKINSFSYTCKAESLSDAKKDALNSGLYEKLCCSDASVSIIIYDRFHFVLSHKPSVEDSWQDYGDNGYVIPN